MPSKSLDDLYPQTRKKFDSLLVACSGRGIQLRITCTYRSNAEQAELYAKGRTKPGTIVTKARPGSSFHNCRRAVDVLILNPSGKVDWEWMDSLACAPLWALFGQLARECKLEWGGYWTQIVDKPHVEDRYCAIHDGIFSVQHFDENGGCFDSIDG